MTLRPFKPLSLLLICGIAACSENGQKTKKNNYVTNAEFVLERIEEADASAVAFQVKPVRQTACEHMYIEFGKQNAEGQWSRTNYLNPGKDKRNNFGQVSLANQIHFAELDGGGEYGVLAIGCKPYNDELMIVPGLRTTFEVKPGKLNYIGEIALLPVGGRNSNFFKVEIADRTNFALEQIQSQLPELETHFQSNLMEEYVKELSPEVQAEIEKAVETARNKANSANQMRGLRNRLVEDAAQAKLDLFIWKEANGEDRSRLTDAQNTVLRQLERNHAHKTAKIRRFDIWIARGKDSSTVQKYFALQASHEQARKNLYKKFPEKPLSQMMSDPDFMNPERLKLTEALSVAREAMQAYEKKHGL